MNNWVVLPLLLPLVTAVILIFLSKKVRLQRGISLVSVLINLAVTVLLVGQISRDGIQTLYMGGWLPPYGIVFVADMFAALLVLITLAAAAASLLFAFRTIGEKREQYYFYPFVQFLLAGVIGSFLTGDLFNLFVCFEVMLISSYALIVLGGTKRQLRETLKYILINILSSTLFVAAMAYLYGAVGTLNMAHLSERVAEAQQGGMLNSIAVMFLIVFALKAGLFLFFWLPGSYSVPPTAVIALFGALLTKVGLYALIRTFSLIFYHDQGFTHSLIGWLAAATMLLGGLGAAAYKDIHRVLNYNVIISVGFIAFGLSVGTREAFDGTVLYLLHDMIAKALLFLLGGMIISAAGSSSLNQMGGLIKTYPAAGWMFFITALALVGIPPLSGFAGKLLIVSGGISATDYWLTGIAVFSSLMVLYSLMNVFIGAFWRDDPMLPAVERKKWPAPVYVSVTALLIIVLGFGLGAEWVYSFAGQAGEVLSNPSLYIDAVLKE
ncbi:NADH/Ubiquinone/plastoquinone (complex I) [Paenibacillus algicola]|uniref:NADH/Ubiquinone/plastoquinone (Complex I) n=1 Tax=Paenibacillus algicola TaxID=2565926 RepID=A0A4P8XR90_9BACL|nr:Na+/H+ antiporter subunit D [Paenibacillus algicola]QCT02989.1 NADH/Ubiquinone/plastoquinone (complex I) [Paenibacillus algicola]